MLQGTCAFDWLSTEGTERGHGAEFTRGTVQPCQGRPCRVLLHLHTGPPSLAHMTKDRTEETV